MKGKAEKYLVGMAAFALVDAAIIFFANKYTLPFSTMWWCAVWSGGFSMWISRFCNHIYNSEQVENARKYMFRDFLIAFMGNFLIMFILGK